MSDARMHVVGSNFVIHQDGAMVHIAFKTVQLLQCKMPNFLHKALNILYRDHISNITLYGSLPRISSTLQSRRLQFAGHCFRRAEEPIHSVLFFEPTGTFRPGGHARMIDVKTLFA